MYIRRKSIRKEEEKRSRKSIRKAEEKRSRKSKKSIRKEEEKRSRKSRRSKVKAEEKRSKKSKTPKSRFAKNISDFFPSNPESNTISRMEFLHSIKKIEEDNMLRLFYSSATITPTGLIMTETNPVTLFPSKYFHFVTGLSIATNIPNSFYKIKPSELFPNLIRLNISAISPTTELDLDGLVHLKSLYMSDINHQLEIRGLTNLEHLHIEYGVIPIIDNSFQNLKYLQIRNNNPSIRLELVGLRNLSILNLTLATGGGPAQQATLILRDLPNIIDFSLYGLGNRNRNPDPINLTELHNLKILNLDCIGVTIDITGLHNIRHLTVNDSNGTMNVIGINTLLNLNYLKTDAQAWNKLSNLHNLHNIRVVSRTQIEIPEQERAPKIVYNTSPPTEIETSLYYDR